MILLQKKLDFFRNSHEFLHAAIRLDKMFIVGVGRAAKFQFQAEPSQKVAEPARAELFPSFFCVILTSQRAEPRFLYRNEPNCQFTSQEVTEPEPSFLRFFSIGVTRRAQPSRAWLGPTPSVAADQFPFNSCFFYLQEIHATAGYLRNFSKKMVYTGHHI